MARPSLRINFSWTLAGNIVYAACQWCILVALAKIGTTEQVGQFALGLTIGAPVILFSQLHLRAVQATDATGLYDFKSYVTLRLITTPLACLAIIGIALAGGYAPATTATVVVIGLMKASDAVSDVYFGAWQRAERMRGIALAQMINGVCSLGALSVALALTGSIVWAAIGALAGSAASLAFVLMHDRSLRRAGLPGDGAASARATDWAVLLRLVQTALPLGIVMLMISLNANAPRYFVQKSLGESDLGIYAGVTYLMMVGVTIVNALGQAASPRLAQYYAARDPRFARLLWQLLAIGGAIGLAGLAVSLVAGARILALVYTPAYASASGLLVWTMAAALVYYVGSVLGYAITAARQLKPQVPLSLVVTAAICWTSAIWVPRWGLEGAIWSYGAGTLIQGLGSGLILWNAFKSDESRRAPMVPMPSGSPIESSR